MFSGLISKTTPIIDVLTVLTGQWDEREQLGWKVVQTPFFIAMDRVCDAGSVSLPFKVMSPVPAMLYGTSGETKALIIKPGDDALVVPEPGVVQVQVFGSATQLKAVR